jgi:hypothetical protein
MATPPSAPIITLAPRASDRTLEFQWSAPTSSGSGPITGYSIEIRDLDGGLALGAGVDGNTFYYKNSAPNLLANGTLYTTTIRATNDGTNYGPIATFRTFAPGSGVPTAPATASAAYSSADYTRAIVSWTPPSNAGSLDSPIFWYVITSPQDSSVKRTADGLTQSSLQITGLNPAASYTFNVRAVNCPGYGPPATTTAISQPRGSVVLDAVSYYTFSPGIILGTNDFSIDGWYKFNTLQGGFTAQTIVGSAANDNGFYAQIQYNPGIFQQLTFGFQAGNSAFSISPITTGVWYYFAFARESGVARAWIGTTPGGTASTAGGGTQTDTRNYSNQTAQIAKTGTGSTFPIQLTNIRINNGSSLFSTASATITIPIINTTASPNTRLLYLATTNGTLATDSSGYQTLTAVGTPTWSAQSPYS